MGLTNRKAKSNDKIYLIYKRINKMKVLSELSENKKMSKTDRARWPTKLQITHMFHLIKERKREKKRDRQTVRKTERYREKRQIDRKTETDKYQ